MPGSLIDELPKIVAEGKKEVEKILRRLESDNKMVLQTNECVLPMRKDSNLFVGKYPNINNQNATGLLFMRGMIDLIYIAPPHLIQKRIIEHKSNFHVRTST